VTVKPEIDGAIKDKPQLWSSIFPAYLGLVWVLGIQPRLLTKRAKMIPIQQLISEEFIW